MQPARPLALLLPVAGGVGWESVHGAAAAPRLHTARLASGAAGGANGRTEIYEQRIVAACECCLAVPSLALLLLLLLLLHGYPHTPTQQTNVPN